MFVICPFVINILLLLSLLLEINGAVSKEYRIPASTLIELCVDIRVHANMSVCIHVAVNTITLIGWKINYPEIGYPEFCQPIEQGNRDPNKALGQSIKITVYLEFAF